MQDGAVAFVHFDAKYRITDLTGLVGKDVGTEEAEREELNEEKAASTTNTYKRGDLLKMHTYNDAIRRTVGSYVLYPGSGERARRANSGSSRRFAGCRRFRHEAEHQQDGRECVARFHREGHRREHGKQYAAEPAELLHRNGCG